MSSTAKVWLFRARAAAWIAIGIWSFTAGQADSVTLVWIASLYANVATDLGGAAAADDRTVLDELAALRAQLSDVQAAVHPRSGGDDP